MKALIVMALAVCLSVCARADVLIVTKDSKGIRARNVRQKGDKTIYVSRATGKTMSLPNSRIDGIAPVLQRGQSYGRKQIEKNIKFLGKLRLQSRIFLVN